MTLINKEIIETLPKLYSQESNPDPIVRVKFFCPWSNWTWYCTEGEFVTEDEIGDFLFFGLVHGFEKEWGYFTLSELESVSGPGGLKIERDLYFTAKPISEIAGKAVPQ
jgi:Protein of unknown function (DUF2958)